MDSTSRITVTQTRHGEPLWDRAEAFLYDNYTALGYVPENDERRITLFDPWNDRSIFHVAEADGRVTGTIRTTMGEVQELPTGRMCGLVDEAPSPAVEVGSLVQPDHHLETLHRLIVSIVGWSIDHEARSLIALIDPWLFQMLTKREGFPFCAIGEPRAMLGGTPMPVSCAVDELLPATRTANPLFWERYHLYRGIDPATVSGGEERFAA